MATPEVLEEAIQYLDLGCTAWANAVSSLRGCLRLPPQLMDSGTNYTTRNSLLVGVSTSQPVGVTTTVSSILMPPSPSR